LAERNSEKWKKYSSFSGLDADAMNPKLSWMLRIRPISRWSLMSNEGSDLLFIFDFKK